MDARIVLHAIIIQTQLQTMEVASTLVANNHIHAKEHQIVIITTVRVAVHTPTVAGHHLHQTIVQAAPTLSITIAQTLIIIVAHQTEHVHPIVTNTVNTAQVDHIMITATVVT